MHNIYFIYDYDMNKYILSQNNISDYKINVLFSIRITNAMNITNIKKSSYYLKNVYFLSNFTTTKNFIINYNNEDIPCWWNKSNNKFIIHLNKKYYKLHPDKKY